tara:strand:- start:225 stop:1436 length:1212 start_codon:yes stop_codon:yes gene_type:complete
MKYFLRLFLLLIPLLLAVGCSDTSELEAENASLKEVTQTSTPATTSSTPVAVTQTSTPTARPTTTSTPAREGEARIVAFSECDMSPLKIKLFVSKLIPNNELKIVEEQVCLSKELYFDRPETNWEMISPLYIALLNRDDSESAVELEKLYCNYILEHHPIGWRDGPCGPYGGKDCETTGKCLFTEKDGKVAGSCICSDFRARGYYLMRLKSHKMPQHEKGYRTVPLHELFHIYQLSSIADPAVSRDDLYKFMGKRMGNNTVDVAWWMEGTATYLQHYFYAQQPGAAPNSLHNEMRRYLTTDYNRSGLGPLPEQYKNAGKPLTEFTFQEPDKTIAYRIGAWFVAFLVDEVGVDKIFEFYQGLEEAGSFETQFVTTFGKSHTDWLKDFDIFLEKPYEEKMAIIPN